MNPWLLPHLAGMELFAAGAMLVLGSGLLLARRVAVLAWLLAVQGGALGAALFAMAVARGSGWLLGLAGLTLLGKAMVLPRLGGWLSHRLDAPGRVPAGLAVAGVGVAVLVLAAAGPVLRPGEALALAVFALGMLGLAGRGDLAGQAAAGVALENGLVLLIAASGAPVGLALASAVLPCAVAAVVLRRVLGARAIY